MYKDFKSYVSALAEELFEDDTRELDFNREPMTFSMSEGAPMTFSMSEGE